MSFPSFPSILKFPDVACFHLDFPRSGHLKIHSYCDFEADRLSVSVYSSCAFTTTVSCFFYAAKFLSLQLQKKSQKAVATSKNPYKKPYSNMSSPSIVRPEVPPQAVSEVPPGAPVSYNPPSQSSVVSARLAFLYVGELNHTVAEAVLFKKDSS